MHQINREELLDILGRRSISPEYLIAHQQARETLSELPDHFDESFKLIAEAIRFAIDFKDLRFLPDMLDRLEAIKQEVLEFCRLERKRHELHHQHFVEKASLTSELAELKRELLEMDSAEELVSLKQRVWEKSAREIVNNSIADLDPDR